MLKINEIFYSIQGESSYAGLPTVFIRLTFCNLRCTYCDSEYSFYDGIDYSIDEIITEIEKYNCKIVEITGGEPLFQKNTLDLMRILCDKNYEVLLETSGSLPIKNVDKRVKIIMDLKTPSSGMEKKNFLENLNYLKKFDEVKFVIGNRTDFEWSKSMLPKINLDSKNIIFSNVFGKLDNQTLAEWILEEKIKVRFQLQMHKYIWHQDKRGV
jgi:7-carboxy-7-deazaguanine synthase